MNYFDNLPKVEYGALGSDELVKMRNIFFRLNLDDLDEGFTRLYRIDANKRLDTVSQELYQTPHYWWIIALLNNINDIIFDLPLHEELLQQVATDRTLEVYASLLDPGALAYRTTQLDELILENDDKRKIIVVNQQYIGRVITEILKSL